MAKDISENTVSAVNQTIRLSDTSVFGNENAKTKILVVGNSITRHGPCAEIGWERDWGLGNGGDRRRDRRKTFADARSPERRVKI